MGKNSETRTKETRTGAARSSSPPRGGMEEVAMIDIVFDGPPGPQSGRFVEVERDGKSISFGKWSQREDGLWSLSIPDPEEKDKVIEGLRESLERCVSDLLWAEKASVGTNFRSSILLAQAALAAAGRKA